MHLLEKKLQQELKRQFPQNKSERIIVGVSGGADSVALLRSLHTLQEERQLEICVAHFDHQTRDRQSQSDAQWVERLAGALHLHCKIGKAPTNDDRSEEALRNQRLDFLIETARQEQAAFICLAHHADDQAETILHHIIRGTGLKGLTGIPTRRKLSDNVTLLHPMLGIRKAEILDYLQSIDQQFRSDVSNQDLQYTRNRIRHQLLPMLNELNSQATSHLLQLSQQVEDTYDYIQLESEMLLNECIISIDNNLVRLNTTKLKTSSPVIVRELFRSIWTRLQWPRKKMALGHWEKLAQFVQNDHRQLELPAAITAQKRGEMIVLEQQKQVR